MGAQQSLTIQQNLAIRLLRVLRYNKARIERALALLPDDQKPLFHVLPFLLHVNHPDLPGYSEGVDVPFGLNNYALRPEVTQALKHMFPHLSEQFDDMKAIWPRQRYIDALVLMGSIGTIAQSYRSDFDYWVCIDSSRFDDKQLQALEQKLLYIEQWALDNYDIEAHFFLSDIEKVRNNDFGVAEGDSAGSAQALFLKAEFYTTNIVVAGKAPFWWLMPDNTNAEQYQSIISTLKEGESPDPKWFMDLGNLEQLDPGELFGAAIWQLSKAMDSPFKSVLKMAKLEVFLENLDTEQPLCNLLKKKVHNGVDAPGNVSFVDPYALMFDQLIEHYSKTEQFDVVALLQECLYIKCGCQLSLPAGDDNNFKRQIMAGYVKQWGWTRSEIRDLDNIKEWSFAKLVALSRRIHSFLIRCYRRMSAKLRLESATVSQEDMTVLGRRLDTFYSKKPNKIEYLRSGFDEALYCPVVTLKSKKLRNGKRQWSLYEGDKLNNHGDSLKHSRLRSDDTPVHVVLWCVSNRIIDSRSRILLDYDTDPVTENDLYQLTVTAEKLFPPIKVSTIPRQDLLTPQRIVHCLAIVNFEALRLKATLDDLLLVYATSWGETFIIQGLDALDGLWFELQEVQPRPACYAMVPESSHRQRIYEDFIVKVDMSFTLID
ncbi:class I adenylate cyclase [Aestuariibacter salexigens]|uniref:class I adenylate cyclase n=1 Tax=Aestuariibacter salexigens TaxID=226010 RepID=UPI00042A06C9|nr:class I adenylate cyclase [Aestuariibacter salexigens]